MIRLFGISPEKILDIRNALTTIILTADMGVNTDKVIQKQARRIDRMLPKVKYEKNLCLKVATRGEKRRGPKCGMRGF